ncbi:MULTISPECIES: ABC transporter permease [unclassified Variovorax]|uniref:ABC transporter permease n=1 Tax=unclassified Variovorax TaxID=663243 RepID=UPI002577715F|nr:MULTISPECIES: ABC transporter permease [unclassified Variovorax]MDM0086125.1 ABC transporter permease [Variovorax sp. J22G40]MDM0145618.1 ABC transporter permease [Variovorax sp. J2P1-31]
MIALARKTMVYEWRRFAPAVFAVGFSGVLLAVQAALVLGIFGSASIYVTASSADLWAGYPGTQSVNFGRDIGPDMEMYLRMDPDVVEVEPYLWVEGDWHGTTRTGGVPVFVSGIRTQENAMMFSHLLPLSRRAQLREPNAVIVDRSDLDQLGTTVGGHAWINGHRVQVVAALTGLRALGGVNVLASQDTARRLQPTDSAGGTPYFVARLRNPSLAVAAQARLAAVPPGFGPLTVWTAETFAKRSRLYWIFDTGAGIAVLFMAAIVCLVGAVLTSQALMAVVASSAREYAMLNALGASLRALSKVVLEQACWIGGIGLLMGAAASALLLWVASRYDVPVSMTWTVAIGCAVLVMGLAVISGLFAVRGLQRAEPAMLLR